MNTGAAPGWTCTRVGTVKYGRKPSKFTGRDAVRVIRKVEWRSPVVWLAAMVELIIHAPVNVPANVVDWAVGEFQARGGEFGGGGGTRGF